MEWVLLFLVLVWVGNKLERRAFRRGRRRGVRDGLAEAARLSREAEDLAMRRHPRRVGGWSGFPRP